MKEGMAVLLGVSPSLGLPSQKPLMALPCLPELSED